MLDEEELELVSHATNFLWARGKTSREMDDWNRRLAELAGISGTSPPGTLTGRFQSRAHERLTRKLWKATVKQLHKSGLADEWQRAWDARPRDAR